MTDHFHHLPTGVLDGYLHQALPPGSSTAGPHAPRRLRTVLEWLEPVSLGRRGQQPGLCAARRVPRCPFPALLDSSRALAAEWDAAHPHTEHDIAQFFRTGTSYLYNLVIWEGSGNRPAYVPLALSTLVRRGAGTVLDYGCGIGSDILPLRQSGFDVVGCDLHSLSTAFLQWRSHSTIPVIEPTELTSISTPDTLWVVDTLDHLPDIETTLGPVLATVDLMFTETS